MKQENKKTDTEELQEKLKKDSNYQVGWVCPKCGKVNAPWKSSCDCVDSYVYYPYFPTLIPPLFSY